MLEGAQSGGSVVLGLERHRGRNLVTLPEAQVNSTSRSWEAFLGISVTLQKLLCIIFESYFKAHFNLKSKVTLLRKVHALSSRYVLFLR